MRIALYVRARGPIKTEVDASLAAQLATLRAWAESYGHEIVGVYEDAGDEPDAERPAFQRLIRAALSKEHPFDAICVEFLLRLAEDLNLLIYVAIRLEKASVTVISPEDDAKANDRAHREREISKMLRGFYEKVQGQRFRTRTTRPRASSRH